MLVASRETGQLQELQFDMAKSIWLPHRAILSVPSPADLPSSSEILRSAELQCVRHLPNQEHAAASTSTIALLAMSTPPAWLVSPDVPGAATCGGLYVTYGTQETSEIPSSPRACVSSLRWSPWQHLAPALVDRRGGWACDASSGRVFYRMQGVAFSTQLSHEDDSASATSSL
jgi:hypothetical protein